MVVYNNYVYIYIIIYTHSHNILLNKFMLRFELDILDGVSIMHAGLS